MVTTAPGHLRQRLAQRREQLLLAALALREVQAARRAPPRSRPGRARPARRGPCVGRWTTTSGKASSACSTRRPSRSDSSSEVPGRVTTLRVSVPSLNSGRKERPRNGTTRQRAPPAPAPRPPSTARGRASAQPQQRLVARLQPAQQPAPPPRPAPWPAAAGTRRAPASASPPRAARRRWPRCRPAPAARASAPPAPTGRRAGGRPG